MAYIEGFVLAVPAANKEAYRKIATEALPRFKEYGATRLVEAWGDDVPDGKVTDFKGAVKAQPDEVVVFSWIEYPDKATRDKANERMMADPAMQQMQDMPFDMKRMIFAGFAPLNDGGRQGRPGYVDGFVTPVPTGNKGAYRDLAAQHAQLLQELGATRVVDAWGDDVPDGKTTDYKGAVKATGDETVVFSWIEWPSKEVRDQAWQKAMSDPRMRDAHMPFDGRRMIYGGFAPIVDG
ncbi:MAG TPA: DUF1428 domain-containing protein [Gammaproteobacteria bacterium]